MKKIAWNSIAAVVLGVLIIGVSGCKKEGPMERTGQKIDEAVEKTGQQIDKGIKKSGENIEKAGDKIKDSVK
ncbi:MAG TPA: hypothetical protein HPP97_03695 [Desulfuromonadales bacterium]|nr:hypothetical protein [Desulfuromonadales bacterium]